MKRNKLNRQFRRNLIVSLVTLSMMTGGGMPVVNAVPPKFAGPPVPVLNMAGPPVPVLNMAGGPPVPVPNMAGGPGGAITIDKTPLLKNSVKDFINNRLKKFKLGDEESQKLEQSIRNQLAARFDHLYKDFPEWVDKNLGPMCEEPFCLKTKDTIKTKHGILYSNTNPNAKKKKTNINGYDVKTICEVTINKIERCKKVSGTEVELEDGTTKELTIPPAFYVYGTLEIPILIDDERNNASYKEKVTMPFFAGRYDNSEGSKPFVLYDVKQKMPGRDNEEPLKESLLEQNKRALENRVDILTGAEPRHKKNKEVTETINQKDGSTITEIRDVSWVEEDLGSKLKARSKIVELKQGFKDAFDEYDAKKKPTNTNKVGTKKRDSEKIIKELEQRVNNEATGKFNSDYENYEKIIKTEKDPIKLLKAKKDLYLNLKTDAKGVRDQYVSSVMRRLRTPQGTPPPSADFEFVYKPTTRDPKDDRVRIEEIKDPTTGKRTYRCYYSEKTVEIDNGGKTETVLETTDFEKDIADFFKKYPDMLREERQKKIKKEIAAIKANVVAKPKVPGAIVYVKKEGDDEVVEVKPLTDAEKSAKKEAKEREERDAKRRESDDATLQNRDLMRGQLEKLTREGASDDEKLEVAKELVDLEEKAKKIEQMRGIEEKLKDGDPNAAARALMMEYQENFGGNKPEEAKKEEVKEEAKEEEAKKEEVKEEEVKEEEVKEEEVKEEEAKEEEAKEEISTSDKAYNDLANAWSATDSELIDTKRELRQTKEQLDEAKNTISEQNEQITKLEDTNKKLQEANKNLQKEAENLKTVAKVAGGSTVTAAGAGALALGTEAGRKIVEKVAPKLTRDIAARLAANAVKRTTQEVAKSALENALETGLENGAQALVR